MSTLEAMGSPGAIAISVIAMITFAGCLVAAFFLRDPTILSIAVGVAAANATTVVNYYLGSSNGSQKKDSILANAAGLGTPITAVRDTTVTSVSNPEGAAP